MVASVRDIYLALSSGATKIAANASWFNWWFSLALVPVVIVKTLIIKYGIYTNIFAEKMWVANHIFFFRKSSVCICKRYTLFFFSKITCELDIALSRRWTFWPLTSSLKANDALNNCALAAIVWGDCCKPSFLSAQWSTRFFCNVSLIE